MRGRNVLMESLVNNGVERIFGNPGTTESPLLDSLSAYPSIEYITALHESVALCAAHYYAQATGKTGVVSLHVAPGLGNAIGMMYAALRAHSPMVITAGQQDTRMRLDDPILGHDLVAMAAPVTKWSVQVERGDEMAEILRRAFKTAHDGPAGPVFVALPIDVMEHETTNAAFPAPRLMRASRPDPKGIEDLADMLLDARNPALMVGDDAARAGATDALVRLAELLGASVFQERFRLRCAFPTDHRSARARLSLDPLLAAKALSAHDVFLGIGGHFFENVWAPSGTVFPADGRIAAIEGTSERLGRYLNPELGLVGDIRESVEALIATIETRASDASRAAATERNAALEAKKDGERGVQAKRAEKSWSNDPISVARAMAEIRDAMPDNVVIVDETISGSADLAGTISFSDPSDYFGTRGGGIGQGLAGALGVKAANPDRPVVCISGDGSAMYSIQAFWTAVHDELPIVFVILGNGEYRVLKHNLDTFRTRFDAESQEPYPHMDLVTPRLDFPSLAHSMGAAGVCVDDADKIAPAIREALASGETRVVEIRVEGRREVPVRPG